MTTYTNTRRTNGVVVAVEESGNVVVCRDDASLEPLFTATNIDGLVEALNGASMYAALQHWAGVPMDLLVWMRGRCYPTLADATAAWKAETGYEETS